MVILFNLEIFCFLRILHRTQYQSYRICVKNFEKGNCNSIPLKEREKTCSLFDFYLPSTLLFIFTASFFRYSAMISLFCSFTFIAFNIFLETNRYRKIPYSELQWNSIMRNTRKRTHWSLSKFSKRIPSGFCLFSAVFFSIQLFSLYILLVFEFLYKNYYLSGKNYKVSVLGKIVFFFIWNLSKVVAYQFNDVIFSVWNIILNNESSRVGLCHWNWICSPFRGLLLDLVIIHKSKINF